MKVLKKRPVAILIMIAAIVLSLGIGYARKPASTLSAKTGDLDSSLDTAYYEQYLYDSADLFSSSAEQTLALYNANWDARYNSLVAVVTVNALDGQDAETYAYDLSADFQLGNGDALLLIAVEEDEFRFVYGDDFATIVTSKTADQLSACLTNSSWEQGTLDFFSELNEVYYANFGLGNAGLEDGYGADYGVSRSYGLNWVVTLVVFLILLVLVLSVIDRARYNTYRARYYGVASPPYVFRPILFWHGPHSGWYRRHWHRPPPPPPGGRGPRPPGGGFGGPTRPSGGNRNGFGGVGNRGPRGGGFGGSRGGGSFGGTRSGGSFSGRGGGFGGFRGGSFGGSRGGGFGGGRGGGFGGRR